MFEQFYAKYPRKEAKKNALKAWQKLSTEQQNKALEAVDKHVHKWELEGTEKTFIPLPASWLNGWRFDDEIEVSQPKAAKWWETDQGILAHGQKVGAPPRAGETMAQYKTRLQTLKVAA